MDHAKSFLKEKLDEKSFEKLFKIDNEKLYSFIAEYIQLCKPEKVTVCDDSETDLQYIRDCAVNNGEEAKLAIEGQTVHFDGYYDQARDKAQTKFMLPPEVDLGANINSIPKEQGINEINEIMDGIMKGHEVYVKFFCLGPENSEFSIPCVQLTDSSYVAHSENILYRQGYQEFIRKGEDARFFKFVHSEGELSENNTSKNIDKRRIYIDCEDGIVYSTNTQYGGNTIGLKKLAMRLAIYRASKEGWLTEHMFVMGINGPDNRKTYFTGAFPSLCGKTSTSMMVGEEIVGDDIAYLRKKGNKVYTANVEKGMFGIIMGINSKDDPLIWKALHSPVELIVSNILITEDKKKYWIDKDRETPEKGRNHSGEWFKGKKDKDGKDITPSHKNARFTVSIDRLENASSKLNAPEGVELSGIIYGGRDSNTWVPVEESFDWTHGIITKGAALESETTAATLGQEGVRRFNPMSNLDFVSVPLGDYINVNLKFGKELENPLKIFSVNYFLKGKDGNFLNEKTDKGIWLKWMELRVHGELDAIKTPTGYIPKYEDLKDLFKKVQNKDYAKEDYNKQFRLNVNEHVAKIERITEIYKTKVKDTPPVLFEILEDQKNRLLKAKEKFGEYITPDKFQN